jgi:predicted amidohydrolase
MKAALCQIDNTVGDLEGNARLIRDFVRRAAEAGAALAVFPELALNGYPPRDLVDKPSFLERTETALAALASETADLPLALVVGYVGRAPANSGKRAANCAAVLQQGRVTFRRTKALLPNYDVFDE